MSVSRIGAIMLWLVFVTWWAPANAQFGNLNGQLPSIFSEVQRIQLIAGGALIFEDGDTAVVGDLTVQLFGIKSSDLDEQCTQSRADEARCGLLALSATLRLVNGVEPVDCIIIGAGADNLLFARCLSDDFAEAADDLDRESNDLAEILVLTGWARADDDNFEGPEIGRYKVAELAAQQNGTGFWNCEESTPRSWASDKNRLCN